MLKLLLVVLDFGIQDSVSHGISPIQQLSGPFISTIHQLLGPLISTIFSSHSTLRIRQGAWLVVWFFFQCLTSRTKSFLLHFWIIFKSIKKTNFNERLQRLILSLGVHFMVYARCGETTFCSIYGIASYYGAVLFQVCSYVLTLDLRNACHQPNKCALFRKIYSRH